ncbi:MAG: anthranilate synthase component I [Veillonellaceae bacterium]|nr:anthranilate synthase component I [Veillonellaceae bacterium]
MNLTPSRTDFLKLCANHSLIPVFADLAVDLETPVSLYYKLAGNNPGFMLESAETSKNFGRYSFLGIDPFLTIEAYRDRLELTTADGLKTVNQSPLTALQELLNQFSFADLPGLPPFGGGAVGYLNFESIATWERIRGLEIPADLLLGEFMCCRLLIAMDHLTHSAKLIYLAEIPSDASARERVYAQAAERIAEIREILRAPLQLPAEEPTPAPVSAAQISPADEEASRARYISHVLKAKEYIAAGEIFQVVPSHPFRRTLTEQPFSLYRRLRRVNPSPYMFFMDFGPRQLVGASPEMLVKLQDGQVFTCPIAGTRPRGKTREDDARLAAELLTDEKECAEHAMLIDLGRNDIGRISLPGTVNVTKLMEVENFSHVMHIVSEVNGTLDPKYTATEVLQACFPAGTVSGAPKIRAIEIINELESERRGPYAGAVGYFDFRGNMDTCITIRTFRIEGDQVTIQTGGGIVADSVPETEYQEIRHKANVLFQVLGGN